MTDATIDVFLLNGEYEVSSLPPCRTFMLSGQLWIDCAPELDRGHTAPVPDNVLISRDEDCLAFGRFRGFVPVGSEIGNLVEVAKRRKVNPAIDTM